MQTFETERLILRKWNTNDIDDFYEIDKNPEVAVPIGWTPHPKKKDAEKMLNILIKIESEWAVILKETGKAIGCMGFGKDSLRPPSVASRNLIYSLNQDYWGHGYCTEAAKCIIKYCFEEIGLEILSVHHYTYNNLSKRVIEKCGFRYDGVIRMNERKKGVALDNMYYSMTRDEYYEIYGKKIC